MRKKINANNFKNIDFLQAYYPGENVWKNFFEGYYHPINTGINAEENVIDRGYKANSNWNMLLSQYQEKYPEDYELFESFDDSDELDELEDKINFCSAYCPKPYYRK